MVHLTRTLHFLYFVSCCLLLVKMPSLVIQGGLWSVCQVSGCANNYIKPLGEARHIEFRAFVFAEALKV